MTTEKFIQLISEILLYVVPGFLILKITEAYIPKKKLPQHETVLWSILYSFIVMIEFYAITSLLRLICRCESVSLTNNTKLVIHLFLALITGLIIVRVSRSALGKGITKLFNPNMEPGEDMWFEVMHAPHGAWATVYLDNGLIYSGMLCMFTADPNDNNKLILLQQYCLMRQIKRNCNKEADGNTFCEVIVDNSKKPDSRVVLKFDNIIAIELVD